MYSLQKWSGKDTIENQHEVEVALQKYWLIYNQKDVWSIYNQNARNYGGYLK